jgi:NitT/TauT family transport system permease protein
MKARSTMWSRLKPNQRNLRVWQLGLLVVIFVFWHVITKPGLIPPFVFENDQQAAFFFGEPLKIFQRIGAWFFTNADI